MIIEAFSAACQSRRGNKTWIGHTGKFTSRSGNVKKNGKNPRATSQTRQASFGPISVQVYRGTNRKRLDKWGLFGEPPLSNKNMARLLRFGKFVLTKPQD